MLLNIDKSVWRRTAGVYIRMLSDPQLFIEGNHRTGALIMSYLLAREGCAPFVLTDKNAREFFNPSSVFKKTKKRSVLMRIKMPGLASAFADYLKQSSEQVVSRIDKILAERGRARSRVLAKSSWVKTNPNSVDSSNKVMKTSFPNHTKYKL